MARQREACGGRRGRDRSRQLTAPWLELVVVVEVDESGASLGKVSARGKLGGHGNDGAAANASSGMLQIEESEARERDVWARVSFSGSRGCT